MSRMFVAAVVLIGMALPVCAQAPILMPQTERVSPLAITSQRVQTPVVLPLAQVTGMPAPLEAIDHLPRVPDFYELNNGSDFHLQALATDNSIISSWTASKAAGSLVANQKACLYLASPPLTNPIAWTPSSITLSGKSILVVIDDWIDPPPQMMQANPQATIQIYAVPLGRLGVGDYRLCVRIRRFEPTGNAPGSPIAPFSDVVMYRLRSIQSASATIHVLPKLANNTHPKPELPNPVLQMKDLKLEALPDGSKDLLYQKPEAIYRELRYPGGLDAVPRTGVWTGTFDSDQWLKADPHKTTLYDNRPGLRDPRPGDPCYAEVFGPSMGWAKDWMSIQEIVWKGKHATIEADVWRTTMTLSYTQGGPFFPMALLRFPNANPSVAAAAIAPQPTADVKWNNLHGTEVEGLYVPDSGAGDEVR